MPRFLRSLAILLSLSIPTARAAIVPGPEIAPVREVLAPTAFTQYQGRIAAGDDGFLAVWHDAAALPGLVLATRISRDGTPLDAAAPLVVSGPRTPESEPDLVWDGRRYLVVWTEASTIVGRFIAPDGAMSPPFIIATAAGSPRVAFNGREFLVAWNGGGGFRAAVVDTNGRVTRTEDLGEAAVPSTLIAIATVDDVSHVVTVRIVQQDGPVFEVGITPVRDDSSISRRIVVATIRPTPFIVPLKVYAASLGGEALVAWSAAGTTWTVRIQGSGYGEVQSFEGDLQVLMADRTGYLFVYDDANGRWVRRADSTAPSPLPLPPVASSATSGADGLLLVSHGADISVQRLDDGTFRPLTIAPRHQTNPAISGTGSLRLAAWGELVDNRYFTVAARIGPDGTPLDPDGIRLEGALWSVSTGAGQWLLVGYREFRVIGARIAFDGTLLDPEPFTIAERISYPQRVVASWDGTRFVVTFMDGVPNRLGGSFATHVAFVTADGTVEPPLLQVSGYGPHIAPAIAAGANGSLVVWNNQVTRTLHGVLVSQAGWVTPLAFPASTRFGEGGVDVAWNGETWLVAGKSDHIRWLFVSPTGVVTPAPAWAYLPTVPSYVVITDVEPQGDGFLIVYAAAEDRVLRAATINRSGYVAHGPIALTAIEHVRAFGAAGSAIIYARPIEATRNNLTRVFVRELAVTPNPPKRRAARR